jgi:arginase family enzyme
MPLAMLCGRAYREQTSDVLGMTAVDETAVLHAGGRELDREEESSLAASGVRVVDGRELRGRGPAEALAPALDALAGERSAASDAAPDGPPPAHLHVDLDVLDPAAAPGVTFPSPRGLSAGQLLESIDLVRERFVLAAVTMASFTPDRDDDAGTTLAAGLAILQRVTSELPERLTD